MSQDATPAAAIDTDDLLMQALLAHRDLCAALRRRVETESGLMSAGLLAQLQAQSQGVSDDPDAE